MSGKHVVERDGDFSYDVCLSFAGEDREYVTLVADRLTTLGVRVFFDSYEEVELWGKDLYTHLDEVYRKAARYCIVFISSHYAKKLWTNHERRSAQARALREQQEYILPARFDDTELPGLPETIHFVDLRAKTPEQFAQMVKKKLGPRVRTNFVPPEPDRLFKALRCRSKKRQSLITQRAIVFLEALKRMTSEEREVVFAMFMNGCPAEMPENIHITLDYLHRLTGLSVFRVKRLLSGIRSLGFYITFVAGGHSHNDEYGSGPIAKLEWWDLSVFQTENATGFADTIIRTAQDGLCPDCAAEALRRLDFGQLSSATAEDE